MTPTTIGLSPKLYAAVAAIIVGLILIALGEREIGLGMVIAGAGQLGIGYVAPPGLVVTAADGQVEDPHTGPDKPEPAEKPRLSRRR